MGQNFSGLRRLAYAVSSMHFHNILSHKVSAQQGPGRISDLSRHSQPLSVSARIWIWLAGAELLPPLNSVVLSWLTTWGANCGWATEQGWRESSWVQVQESFISYFVELVLIHLGMKSESAHIIFKAMKLFKIFSLESLLILCALLHLTRIRAQMLSGEPENDRDLGSKAWSEIIDM